MKILVFATDVLPLPGLPTSGTALRTYGLVQGFRAFGYDVFVSVPRTALKGLQRSLKERPQQQLEKEILDEVQALERLAFDSANQEQIIELIKPDLILCGHWPALTLKRKPKAFLVVDLAGPHLLERHYQKSPDQGAAIVGKLTAISRADALIVSGKSQLNYFRAFYARTERKHFEDRAIIIHMPLDPELPNHHYSKSKETNYPNFIFAGVFLPWQDPSWILTNICKEIEERNSGTLTLIGGTHPHYKVDAGIYNKLFSELKTKPFVKFMPMLSFEEFQKELLGAHCAIDLMSWNLERELAFTIRSTTYLWAGVPIIYNSFADLAYLIQKYNAGWQLDHEDKQGLKELLNTVYLQRETIIEKSHNAQKLAANEFAWDRALKPLVSFLETNIPLEEISYLDIDTGNHSSSTVSLDSDNNSQTTLQQFFVSRVNKLHAVQCLFQKDSPDITTESLNGKVTVSLSSFDSDLSAKNSDLPNKTSKVLFTKTLATDTFPGSSWFRVSIPPQSDSAGKTYCLSITNSSPTKSGIKLRTVSDSPFPFLGLQHNGNLRKQESLILRTYGKGDSSNI